MTLLSILKRNPDVRRLFGKRELVIIEKQLQGVRLKPSERTRLSRDIRKKFEAIKDLAAFSGDFRLKTGSEIRRLIGDAKEVLLGSGYGPRIKSIILYGSAVEGSLTLSSDIDLAVVFGGMTVDAATKFRRVVQGLVSERVDVQVYDVLPAKVRKEIDENGRAIYARKNICKEE